jgi:5'-deoxynucleotidase
MKKENHHFFAFLSRMKYINRWGLMRNTQTENIAEHSLQVAMIAHGLAVIANRLFGGRLDEGRAAVLALYHDSGEIITGDMPTPVKYFNPALREAYKGVEETSKGKILSMLPPELKEPYEKILLPAEGDGHLERLVRAADKISAYIKCVEELRAGNREFGKAAESTLRSIRESPLPEVDYFMEHFMGSFSLTLDELD